MAFDLLVRTFFADNGLSAGLAKANAGLQQLGKSGPGARSGLRAVEMGARSLAFEAAGLQGPLGRIAAGLLQLGGGSALVLGVVAGVGAIALAYRALTADSRAAAEEQAKLRDELVRTAAQRAAGLIPETQQIGSNVATARAELARLNRERSAVVLALSKAGGAGSQQDIELGISDKLRKIDEDRAKFSATINQNRRAAVPAAEREADASERSARAAREEALARAQINLERDIALGRLRTVLPLLGGGTGLPKLEGGLGPAFKPEKFAPREFFVQDLVKEAGKVRPPAPDPARLAAEAVALLGAMKQGGIGNILGGVGGGLSALSGLKGLGGLEPFGIIGTALGGVFNLFDNSEERRHKELVKALTDLRPIMEATRAAVYLVDSRTGETRQLQYAIGRREDRDAIDRNGEGL